MDVMTTPNDEHEAMAPDEWSPGQSEAVRASMPYQERTKRTLSLRDVVTARLESARYPLIATGGVAFVSLLAGASPGFVVFGFSTIIAAAAIGPRTSRNRRIAALSRSNGKRRSSPPNAVTVLDALPDPAVLVAPDQSIIHQNEAAAAVFGPSLPGVNVRMKFRAPELRDLIERAVAERRPATLPRYSPTAGDMWFDVHVAPVFAHPRNHPRNEPDIRPHYMLVFRDQTDAMRLDRVRADFVANASHELRTPLTSLIGYIDTLRGPARDDEAARERFLGIMAQQAGRMSRLVEDLTQLSRAERRERTAPRDIIDLAAVVSDAVDTARPMFEEAGMELSFQADGPLCVAGDRDELIRVVENLIENARTYGASGGKVAVRVSREGEQVRTSVRDWGPGIAMEHLPRLTERFYRVDVEASKSHRGTGLGLAIVKHVLKRHNSRLGIRSKPGEGAEFSFVLSLNS